MICVEVVEATTAVIGLTETGPRDVSGTADVTIAESERDGGDLSDRPMTCN
jgi:hypothetical protein